MNHSAVRQRSATRLRLPIPGILLTALFAGAIAPQAVAQCDNVLQQGGGLPGFDHAVFATCLWDPDGTGPLGMHVVFGGEFTVAGDLPVDHIVARDLTTGEWRPIGAGLPDNVTALHVRPNGDLIAGGRFSGQVARWTGTAWQTFGAALNPTAFYPEVYDFAELPNGSLVACGAFFVFTGGVFCHNIARWNGTAWSGLGTGLAGTPPNSFATASSLAVLGNGDLVVTGSFTLAGGVTVPKLARWNGSTWSGLGSGPGVAGGVLHVLPGGDLLAGGSALGGGILMSRWNGATWQPFGPAFASGNVVSMCQAANGDLVIAGRFDFGGTQNVLRWDGAAWSGAGAGIGGDSGTIRTIQELPAGELLATGVFVQFGQYQRTNAAVFDGVDWSPIAPGFDGVIRASALRPNGNLVVGGYFTTAGGRFVESIAEWDGAAWQPLGAGLGGITNQTQGANCICTLPGGDLVVGGWFTTAGGVSAANIARWNGTSWSPLGAGIGPVGNVQSMVVMPNGDLIVGGYFASAGGAPAANIARWDGVAWSPLGAGTDNGVLALAVLPNGDLVATGTFSQAGGQIGRAARWNGTSWSPLGVLPQGAGTALLAEPNGDLLLGGSFSVGATYDNRMLWRWDGLAWTALGPYVQNGLYAVEVDAMVRHANGDLLVGGTFATAGATSIPNVARWDGSSWSALGGGTDGRVRTLLLLDDGDLWVGGDFVHAQGQLALALARFGTTCPAAVTALGDACVSPYGPMVLAADSLPWIGGNFDSTCTGVDPAALAFAVYGLTAPGVPFSALHPVGDPTCSLWASPDVAWYAPTVAGAATSRLSIPAAPTLYGVTLTHQFVEFEFGAGPSLTRIGGSNGSLLTLGVF